MWARILNRSTLNRSTHAHHKKYWHLWWAFRARWGAFLRTLVINRAVYNLFVKNVHSCMKIKQYFTYGGKLTFRGHFPKQKRTWMLWRHLGDIGGTSKIWAVLELWSMDPTFSTPRIRRKGEGGYVKKDNLLHWKSLGKNILKIFFIF